LVEPIKEFWRHQRWVFTHELLDFDNALGASYRLDCP
jgi:hypothetical protein